MISSATYIESDARTQSQQEKDNEKKDTRKKDREDNNTCIYLYREQKWTQNSKRTEE